MANVDNYRKGFERAREDAKKANEQGLAEQFVKGVVNAPMEAVRDLFLRTDDEDRGYRDGRDGKEFNPKPD